MTVFQKPDHNTKNIKNIECLLHTNVFCAMVNLQIYGDSSGQGESPYRRWKSATLNIRQNVKADSVKFRNRRLQSGWEKKIGAVQAFFSRGKSACLHGASFAVRNAPWIFPRGFLLQAEKAVFQMQEVNLLARCCFHINWNRFAEQIYS